MVLELQPAGGEHVERGSGLEAIAAQKVRGDLARARVEHRLLFRVRGLHWHVASEAGPGLAHARMVGVGQRPVVAAVRRRILEHPHLTAILHLLGVIKVEPPEILAEVGKLQQLRRQRQLPTSPPPCRRRPDRRARPAVPLPWSRPRACRAFVVSSAVLGMRSDSNRRASDAAVDYLARHAGISSVSQAAFACASIGASWRWSVSTVITGSASRRRLSELALTIASSRRNARTAAA